MQSYEVKLIIDNIKYLDRTSWEQTRLRIFGTASMFSKGGMSLQDIMEFPWEKEGVTKEITNSERDRLKARAEELARTMRFDAPDK